mmetsp:Transcript_29622/g.82784  ORF Transcript_29622/g.82784 Transcript_29622/m.82784 type:complete len:124 (+) Transcript_29622:1-372(+)
MTRLATALGLKKEVVHHTPDDYCANYLEGPKFSVLVNDRNCIGLEDVVRDVQERIRGFAVVIGMDSLHACSMRRSTYSFALASLSCDMASSVADGLLLDDSLASLVNAIAFVQSHAGKKCAVQ